MARTAAAAKLARYRARRDFTMTPEPRGVRARTHVDRGFVVDHQAITPAAWRALGGKP
jgi:hypothetical protein